MANRQLEIFEQKWIPLVRCDVYPVRSS